MIAKKLRLIGLIIALALLALRAAPAEAFTCAYPGSLVTFLQMGAEDGTWKIRNDVEDAGAKTVAYNKLADCLQKVITELGVAPRGGYADVVTRLNDAVSFGATRAANFVLAGPTSGAAAAPSFRILVAGDIPSLAASIITSGVFGVANGGSGADLSATGGTGKAVFQETLGAPFTVRVLGTDDLPAHSTSLLTSGVLPEARGGTNQGSYSAGDLLYASAGNTLSRLGIGADGKCLVVTAGAPGWNDCAAGSSHNLLSATHPDTVASSPVLGDVLYSNSTPAWQALAGNTTSTKKYLSQTGNGSISAAPAWSALDAGDIGSGTLGATRGGTGINTYVSGDTLYASAANTLSRLAKGTDGQCYILASGIPSWGSCAGGSANHNLLSASHPDTVAASPVLGDVLYGNATPAWTKLAGNTTTTRKLMVQTGNGSVSAAPAWDTLVAGDIPNVSAAIITSGTLGEARGGTNQSTYTTGDTLYASASNTLSKLGGNTTTTKKFLRQTGDGANSAAPAWDTVVAADVSGVSTPSSGDTFTNKALDAEGTGNVVTVPVKFTIPLAGCNNATAGPVLDVPTSNGLTANCFGTSPHRFAALDAADGASALTVAGHFLLPSDWTGAIDVKATAFSSSTLTNNFITTVQTVCVADGEDILNPTYNTAQTITKANNASANTRNSVTLTSVTTTGCAAGETFFWKFGRDPTNGSDTLAATVSYMDIEWTYRRAM